MTTDRRFRQCALGAVLGSAAGDALGAPFEFQPAGTYGRRFPEPVLGGIGEQIGGGGFGWAPGEVTDDTQMAIIQAQSLLEHTGIDGADLFERFRIWARTAGDVGNQTRAALASGLPWDQAAAAYFEQHPSNSAGNGGLMRATPSAVYFAQHDLAVSMQAARELTAITHGDPAAQWGAALFHAMIHAALRGDDPFAALDAVLVGLPGDQVRFVEMLAPGWTPDRGGPSNGSVWGCLAQAVWAVRSTTTFEDALVAAVQLGDDADTVAAVTGGLAGAVYGVQAIPSRWTTYLHARIPGREETFRSVDLQELTLRLLGQVPAPEHPAGAPIGPTEIVPGLYAANLSGAATVPTGYAVISLCRVDDLFREHPIRRELYVIDQEADHNAALGAMVRDAVDSIDAFHAEGLLVVLHCHGGASRTGLVLRAWLMRTNGWDEPTATQFLEDRWPTLGLWNESFTEFLRTAWAR